MPPSRKERERRSGFGGWAPKLGLMVAAPILFLVALEFSLRLVGYGRPAAFLIPDDMPGYYRTNPEYASLFLPGNFDLRPLNLRVAARKPPGTIRVVVLGESAAQGIPVPSFGFAPQLRAQLRQRYPGRSIEVIDTGIVAVNSHVVRQIALDMARFEPDLFVVYMGNNEVVGPYGPGCAYLSAMPPLWLIRTSVFARSTRTGQLIGAAVRALGSHGRRPPDWGGMSMFVDHAVAGDDPRLRTVYANFESNLRDIVAAASGCGAKTLLCTVVANLKDCPPFLSVHRPGISGDDLQAWTAAFGAGRLEWSLGRTDDAERDLQRALRLDPEYADTDFMLASLALGRGQRAEAIRGYAAALHWDALRFRPDAAINAIIRRIAAENPRSVTLVDAAMELGADAASQAEPSGREILFEHVHFDWPGNYRVAAMMAEAAASTMGGAEKRPLLSSDECAAALAYTPHERLPMLIRMEVLVRKPPFTGQLTHILDEARMGREIEEAKHEFSGAASTKRARAVAEDALSADPGNPALEGILEGILLDSGEPGAALEAATRAASQLPRDFALDADRASILLRTGGTEEAGRLLLGAARSGADLDNLIPLLSDYWSRAGRIDQGVRFLDDAIARRPGDLRLRVARAGIEASSDPAAAEKDYRAVLDADPASEDALEGLRSVLVATGRTVEADETCLVAAPRQPRNQANDLRAARLLEDRRDPKGEVGFLEAAEMSGPVNSVFELTLALKLYRLGRGAEMMERLASARQLALAEGNTALLASIDSLISRLAARP